jgi:hypothetical protein
VIADLAPLAAADLPLREFGPGTGLPEADGRGDMLRIGCAIADLPALAAVISTDGPRIRLEVAAVDGWPQRIDVGALVTGGVMELALELPDRLDPDTWVRLVALLVGAREHGLPVQWRLPVDGPSWAEPSMLQHLPPPLDGDVASRWRQTHQFGQLYWRRGPGFVAVIDARGDSRIRYVIDEAPLLASFHAVHEPCPIDSVESEQLIELIDARLAVRGDTLAVGLAYRLLHTPMPGYQI